MADQPGKFIVNGEEYEISDEFTLGEMCDAEQYFGVEFGENARPGVRLTAALLWIAMRRKNADVTPEDILSLPMDSIKRVAADGSDAGPPALPIPKSNGSSNTSGDGSANTSDGQETTRAVSGIPG